jgi:hypothetical protein
VQSQPFSPTVLTRNADWALLVPPSYSEPNRLTPLMKKKGAEEIRIYGNVFHSIPD